MQDFDSKISDDISGYKINIGLLYHSDIPLQNVISTEKSFLVVDI